MFTIDITENLRFALPNYQSLVNHFHEWKQAGEQGENDFYLFGKDGAYIAPKVNDESYVLRHVHFDILNEPFAQMKTEQHRLIMNNFAKIAESYIYHGEIIA